MSADPLLTDADQSRFTLVEMKGPFWDMYQTALSSFWRVQEVDLSRDLHDWNKTLKQVERDFIKTVLAFFASSDGIVNENLAARFYGEVKVPEARCFYAMQMLIESIHSEMYTRLLMTYVPDMDERNRLFHAINEIPAIKRKADWALQWISSKERSFAERLVAFACVEGIFFSSSFCAIFWLKKRGLLPGLTVSNEFISRDEGMHTDFACLLHNSLQPENRAAPETIKAILHSAGELEKQFVMDALPVALIGMNATLMCQYVEFVTDRLAGALGIDSIYGSKNPFDFMDNIGISGKTNFFEKRVADYKLQQQIVRTLDFSESSSIDF